MVFEHDYKKFPELTNQQINDFGLSSPHKQYTEDFDATVVKVTDGDTISLRTVDRDFDFPLRLSEINTKELNEGGEEAKEWLRTQIENQPVRILVNSKNRVGRYGRLLGTVIHNGTSLNDELMHKGLATPFNQRNDGKIPAHQKDMKPQEIFKSMI